MPTWGETRLEIIGESKKRKTAAFDYVRRKYLTKLYNETGRNVILYATAWQSKIADSMGMSIIDEDIHGLMEVLHGLEGSGLDLIIHSLGGSPEAAEAIVSYLRSKFDDIRVIVPNEAMSAATMLACSANIILMGEHSFLGPIDPQLIIPTSERVQAVPAQSIIDQFEMAKKECKDAVSVLPWVPILSQLAPALLAQCKEAQEFAVELVSKWLEMFMFNGESEAKKKARQIARSLADRSKFKSHRRKITREQVKEMGLKVEDLESDANLQDLVLGVFHATMHTFNGTPALKIIENHLGKAFVKIQQLQAIPVSQGPIPEQLVKPTPAQKGKKRKKKQ